MSYQVGNCDIGVVTMQSAICERAIEDALKHGQAILKYISANDVGITGGHQCGFYLPKAIWQAFTPFPPNKGENNEHKVTVLWPDGRSTDSTVKWYGKGTRSEYRLTRFGRDFPWNTADNLGDLLVLIPKSINEFTAYVLDLDEDIEEIQAVLGIEVIESWSYYKKGLSQKESENSCINKRFRAFTELVDTFPGVKVFSKHTIDVLLACVPDFTKLVEDDQLLRLISEEYTLYRMVERKVFQPEVGRLFASIDDFLQTALSILQARKARAGRSLENHIEYLLVNAGVPYQMRPVVDDTRPDVIIPSKEAYLDQSFPNRKLFMIGVKRTCKDRWRQVTKEAPRIKHKHILTLQEGISRTQLDEMSKSKVTLIVPNRLHKEYPGDRRDTLLNIHDFITTLKKIYT